MKRFWAFGPLLLATACMAAEKKELVKASLVAGVTVAQPGVSFNVGVLLKMEPQWHVYWENPGESGSPTRVALKGPQGVAIGPVRYPLPMEFKQPGDISGFGYEGEVMLLAKVTLPKDWPAGKAVELSGTVSWLVCKDVCLPGRAEVSLRLETGLVKKGADAEQVAQWEQCLPQEAGEEGVPFKAGGDLKKITLEWKSPPAGLKIWAAPPEDVEVGSMKVTQEGLVTWIVPELRLLGGEKRAGAAVGFLVTYDDAAGQRRGVRIGIPLRG